MVNPNIQQIKEDFDTVIRYSQGISDPKTDRLFEIWQESKKRFVDAFGGQYIFEYPEKVSFELNEKEKHERVMQFAQMVENTWGYSELAQFIEEQESGFFNNLTVTDYRGWDGKMIKKGTKLVRSFKHFTNNERSLTDIQNEASRIIQEDRIEGTLCFSVHPLDFLSLSETTYNWRSCHALDGEYCAGNLSYMMDKSTVVCYLKSDENVVLNGFGPEVKWNSKKWRVLLYLSNDENMIFAGRQYPFSSDNGLKFVLEKFTFYTKLNNSIRQEYWSNWNKVFYKDIDLNGIQLQLNDSYVVVGNDLIPLSDLVINVEGSKQYNDVLYSSCYVPMYAFKYTQFFFGGVGPLPKKDQTKFEIGNYTYCLWCGEEECMSGADTMMCERCELEHGTSESDCFCYCDCCGRRMFYDDSYSVDGEYLCCDCYDRYYRECENCHEPHHIDYIHYDEDSENYLCDECLSELHYERKRR